MSIRVKYKQLRRKQQRLMQTIDWLSDELASKSADLQRSDQDRDRLLEKIVLLQDSQAEANQKLTQIGQDLASKEEDFRRARRVLDHPILKHFV